MDFIMTQSRLAELFGVSERSIREFGSQGMPRLSNGKYNAPACVAWLKAKKKQAAEGKGSDEYFNLLRAQTTLLESRNAETRAGLIERSAADEAYSAVQRIAVEKIRESAARQSNPDIQAEMLEVAADIESRRPDWPTGMRTPTAEVDKHD